MNMIDKALMHLGLNKPIVVILSAAKNLGVTGGMLHSVQHDRLRVWGYLRPSVLTASRTPNDQQGQSTVEIAFLLPILMVLLYGIIAAGFVFYAFITVSNAARDAARAGSVYRLTRAASGLSLEETVENAVYDPGPNPDRTSLGFLSTTAPSFDVVSDVTAIWVDVDGDSLESVGDQLTASVTYRYTIPLLSDFVPMFPQPIVIVRNVTMEIQ